MKLEITTTAERVEKVNYILAQAINALKDSPNTREAIDLTEKDIEEADEFRKHLVDVFLKLPAKNTDSDTESSNSVLIDWTYDDEYGTTVTIKGIVDIWCVVEDIEHDEPYCVPLEFVKAIYHESIISQHQSMQRAEACCKGSIALGTACMKCPRCKRELAKLKTKPQHSDNQN